MLRTNPGTYCWSPPLTREALERQHLVQKVRGGRYEDYLLFRRGYGLSPLDEAFLDILSRHTPGN